MVVDGISIVLVPLDECLELASMCKLMQVFRYHSNLQSTNLSFYHLISLPRIMLLALGRRIIWAKAGNKHVVILKR